MDPYNLIEITLRDMLEYYLQINILPLFRQLKNYVSAHALAKKERICLSVRDNVFMLLIVRKS